MKYLYPAINFNFGLFGNWKLPKYRFKIWKNFLIPKYKKVFARISKGKISQEDLPYLYSSSKIILNCTLPVCIEWDVITLRTFEVLACNGFLITDIVPSALKMLKDHVVFTTGGQDLVEKIKYYLHHEEERIKIASKGYEFVKNNVSLDNRVDQLIKYINEVL
jgi:spore maturation protein CgeB